MFLRAMEHRESKYAETGEVHAVRMSRGQRVVLERAARQLEGLDLTGAQDFAAELRVLADAWRGAQAVEDSEREAS